MRRNTQAAEASADAQSRRATASETVAAEVLAHANKKRKSKSGFDHQPHEDDPNQAALDI